MIKGSGNFGLWVDKEGTIMLGDKPFWGMGVNLFAPFIRNVLQPERKAFKEDFALMKKYNVPFVRIPFSGWDCGLYNIYADNKELYFSYLDEIVREAEMQKLGIIASLMWMESAVPCFVKEKRCNLGNPDSKTVAFAKQYVADVVNRYKDSPAIWGWEIGNEYNLTADLFDPNFKDYLWPDIESMPHGEINGEDYYTSAELRSFLEIIGKEIRKYDNHRCINTGHGDMRTSSKALHKAALHVDEKHRWEMPTSPHVWDGSSLCDSFDDFCEMNAYFTPDPIDTMCFHLQHSKILGSSIGYDETIPLDRWGRKDLPTLEYFKGYVEAARRAKKGLFYGEFGDFIEEEEFPEFEKYFANVMKWIKEAGIQIAASWQFCYKDGYIVANDIYGNDGYKLRLISEYNLQYQKEGKQDLSVAWQM